MPTMTDERYQEIRAMRDQAMRKDQEGKEYADTADMFAHLLDTGPAYEEFFANLSAEERAAFEARLEQDMVRKGTDMGGWVTY